MSTVTSSICTCPNLQGMLVDYFQTCPVTRRPQSPLFTFLNSGENRSNLRSVINPTGGRKRTITLTYDQPVTTNDVDAVASCDRVCDATTERGDLCVDYTIECTDGYFVEEKVRLSDWNESCKSDGQVMIAKIANLLDGLMARMYQKVAEDMPPLLGAWSSDVNASWVDADDFLNVATEKTGSDDINVTAFQRINLAKMQTGYCAPTFLVGGADLYSYYQLMRAGCCADQGLDALAILQQYGEAVAYDRYVATEFGNDTSLLLQTGSIQLLSYNAVTPIITDLGVAGLDMTYRNYFEAIILDPLTGFPVDLSIKSDCGVVHIVMTATAKPVALPFDLYPSGHPNEGVNFAAGIQVVNS